MNARRRQADRRNWPANLYQNPNGYLWYRNPLTKKTLGLGYDVELAKRQVKRANLELAHLQEQRNLLAATGTGEKTLVQHCDDYQVEYTKDRKKNTKAAIVTQLNAIREDVRAKKPISQFTPLDAVELIKLAALERGASSAARIRSRLLDVFRDAITHALIEVGKNPVEAVLKPKVEVARMRMTEEMFWAILDEVKDPWLKNALLLALLTGQRVGDVQKMRFDDVRDGFLWVDQEKKGGKTKLKIPVSLSLGQHSIASVIAQCRDNVVSRFLIHYREERYSAMRGKQVEYNTLNRRFREARDAAKIDVPEGLTPVTFHEIRSLTARMLADAYGEDTAQSVLGHRSKAMTEHYIDTRGQQWVEVVLPAKAG